MRYTEEYKALQQQLHAQGNYGGSGHKHAQYVLQLAQQLGSREVLDYGCGQCTLAKSLPFRITNYDPMQPEYDTEPEPHDLVVCSDVLEHIEPECLESVLEHLRSLTKRVCFIDVACRPANKTLADGRNAHLIQDEPTTWLNRVLRFGFKPTFYQVYNGGFIAVLTP